MFKGLEADLMPENGLFDAFLGQISLKNRTKP